MKKDGKFDLHRRENVNTGRSHHPVMKEAWLQPQHHRQKNQETWNSVNGEMTNLTDNQRTKKHRGDGGF